MTIEKNELSRRTLVKGAAWSLPVIAVAAATPMAAASTATQFDVGVAPSCVGNYDLDGLLGLIAGVPGVGGAVANTVQTLLAGIGLTPFESRGFTITAVEGTVPQGTQFTLSTAPGLIDLALLDDVIDADVLGLVSVNGNSSAIVELVQPLTVGQSTTIQLSQDAVDLGVTGAASLALNGSDNPSTGAGAPNSADLNLISVDTNLGSLVDLGDLGIILAPLVSALEITVQLCPGQTLPAQP
ncbi:hypothetical protein [Microbacterium sp. NPDC058345]|uniref:hypothetical protein n=1 Tax=Microbacterium sp. NPDC058345 TaxID=3346455 RepID=UPI0036633D4D